MVWISNIEKLNQMTVDVWAELIDVNWQNTMIYLVAKSDLWLKIQEICRELNIKYYPPSKKVKVIQYPNEYEYKSNGYDKLE